MAQINLKKTIEEGVYSTSGNVGVFVNNENELSTILEDGTIKKYKEETKKIYRALLTQVGASAPTVIILENTLGEELSLHRIAMGQYSISSHGLFTLGKTFVLIGSATDGNPAGMREKAEIIVGNVSVCYFVTRKDGSLTDNLLLRTPVLIEIYP